jgi:poly(glycerol-phosphate) alpha-glucosyltransferase
VGDSLAGARIGLLTASASRAGGGVFEAVVAQAGLVRGLGGAPHVFALRDAFSDQDRARFGNVSVTFCPVTGPAQIGFAPGLAAALQEADLACLHLHGIWMYPSRAGARWAGKTGKPYLISPHGMLDPWITARGRWKKAAARAGYERDGWRRATRLHALTPREALDIAHETGRQDSVVIPNAGPAAVASPTQRPPVAVYIGRIHAKKNLLALVDGWAKAALPDARLKIAGWGDAADIAALTQAIAACAGKVEFLGPVFGDEKQALLDEARFIILPSLSEGLPMAILEAWANGVPTIMTRECNLSEGFTLGAALECGIDARQIADVCARAFALTTEQWWAMAEAAIVLARGRFSAAAVAAQWGETYGSAIAGVRK